MILVVALIATIQAAVWIPLVASWNEKSEAFFSALETEMAASGETSVLPLQKAKYQGASKVYGPVAGTGRVMLTDRRLVFRKLTGGVIEIPTSKIKAMRESGSFRNVGRIGVPMSIIETTDPAEVGFNFVDATVWKNALERVLASDRKSG